jgi:hypothetical protein
MEENKIQTVFEDVELPFFPGYYESILYSSDDSYWGIKEEVEYYQRDYAYDDPEEQAIYAQITEDDLDFDFAGYTKEMNDYWVDAFRANMPEIVVSVEDVVMSSPRYYNFETDRLWATVTLVDDWQDKVRAFMEENKDWLRERIENDWTSYDGFASFMSNNFDDTSHDDDDDYWGDKSWYFHLFSGNSDRWGCYISTIIGYMMYRENKEIRDDLVMYALDDVYAGSYVFLTDEGKAKVEAGIEDGSVKVYDPDQLQLPFED